MRYIIIHAEDTPLWGADFEYWAKAAVIHHRLNLGDFTLTDRQKMTLSRYLNPPKPISIAEIEAKDDISALSIAKTVSEGGPMELFQV